MDTVSELASTVERLSKAPTRSDLEAFPALYRDAVAELADGRAKQRPQARLRPLEAALVRAHGLLYAPAPVALRSSLMELASSFPRAVRRSGHFIFVAVLAMFLGGLWGYVEVSRDPSRASVVLGSQWLANAEHFAGGGVTREGHPLYAAFYFTNNARVALNAFALGATCGVGTILSLVFNGVILGGTIAVTSELGASRALLSFVVAHGVLELAAIAIAAAGGLQLGWAILAPGWQSRGASLRAAARNAMPLALGASGLLAIAGLLEGWVSPLPLPLGTKVAIGVVVDALVLLYLLLVPGKASNL